MTPSSEYLSWGLFPRAQQTVDTWLNRSDSLPPLGQNASRLCYGMGRSYGDSCLNDGAELLRTTKLDHFIDFDPRTGVMCCESGVTIEGILRLIVPQGWFVPVTPGTKFVTIGGAIANDVHGKNHHCDGNFGHHVLRFELVRSDGSRLICSPKENRGLFLATIGGMGLTGAISWAEFQLKRISNPFIVSETVRFSNLTEFFELSRESERNFTYTVSWVDCLATKSKLGRGHFIRGNHAPSLMDRERSIARSRKLSVPFFFPNGVLNPLTVYAFNQLYYNKQQARSKSATIPFDPFFYPLDSIRNWNRIYGPQGFLQWQCVVPFSEGEDVIREIFTRIASSRQGSFLAVLKTFGTIPSLGLLSFPREGVTLALDFPHVGQRLIDLLADLDRIVLGCGGAIYPAKDARMSAEVFRSSYPRINEFLQYKDPEFSSSFWRRVMEG